LAERGTRVLDVARRHYVIAQLVLLLPLPVIGGIVTGNWWLAIAWVLTLGGVFALWRYLKRATEM